MGGMLALRRFTIAELATHADVPEGSVRSFLSRRPGLVDQDEKVSIGGSGRPAIRRRLNDEAASKVSEELRALTGRLVRDLGPEPEVEPALESEPRSLVLLEKIVARLTTEAALGEEREEKIEEAQLQARLTLAALDDREEVLGRAEPHLRARLSKASTRLAKATEQQRSVPSETQVEAHLESSMIAALDNPEAFAFLEAHLLRQGFTIVPLEDCGDMLRAEPWRRGHAAMAHLQERLTIAVRDYHKEIAVTADGTFLVRGTKQRARGVAAVVVADPARGRVQVQYEPAPSRSPVPSKTQTLAGALDAMVHLHERLTIAALDYHEEVAGPLAKIVRPKR